MRNNSGWMMANVSRKMNFDDHFYFSGVFRKVMGMSPGECLKRWVYFRLEDNL